MRLRLAVIACTVLCAGCLWGGGDSSSRTDELVERRLRPVLELAGQSRAFRATSQFCLPAGLGAEGAVGDFVLENAFARFVVSDVDHVVAGCGGGNLIDAAIQGGDDLMRGLVPRLGEMPRRRPVYERVIVAERGGLNVAAVVEASGHVAGVPELTVTTKYTLKPGSRMLGIATSVGNTTDSMAALFTFGDSLYHGRTLRYVPGAAPRPFGASSTVGWLAFYNDGLAWGMVCPPGQTMEEVNHVGSTELRYAVVDIPPGGSKSYERSLVAVEGGPEGVWSVLYHNNIEDSTTLRLVAVEGHSERPVPHTQIVVEPCNGGSPFLVETDGAGQAELTLPAGAYRLTARAPGRCPTEPVQVECFSAHELRMYLSRRAEARVKVRAKLADYIVPTAARLTPCRMSANTPRLPGAPGFPVTNLCGAGLIDGAQEAVIALAPATEHEAGRYVLVASKGPLYEFGAQPVAAAPGRSESVELTVERVVDPGRYVAVDFRQYGPASADCALTPRERELANACEGLDGAIVSDPTVSPHIGLSEPDDECLLVPGMRAGACGTGSFSVFPVGRGSPGLGLTEGPASALLQGLREAYPGAIIQVDNPLDKESGYIALCGPDPTLSRTERAGFSTDFDALEVLSGSRVSAADELLPTWFHLLNAGHRIFATGGSGSQGIIGDVAGIARTFVDCPRAGARPTPEELTAAILRLKEQPNAFVTNGPFIEASLDGWPIGSTQKAQRPTLAMRLRVSAPSWVDVRSVTVYRNGVPVEDVALEPPQGPVRCDLVLNLQAPTDCWFVVCVRGVRPMTPVYGLRGIPPAPWAVTNPFWVDADGDGQVSVAP